MSERYEVQGDGRVYAPHANGTPLMRFSVIDTSVQPYGRAISAGQTQEWAEDLAKRLNARHELEQLAADYENRPYEGDGL
jgi:hypothetical protein